MMKDMKGRTLSVDTMAAMVNDPFEVDAFLERLPQDQMINPGSSCGNFLYLMCMDMGLPDPRVGLHTIFFDDNPVDSIDLSGWNQRWQKEMIESTDRVGSRKEISVADARRFLSTHLECIVEPFDL